MNVHRDSWIQVDGSPHFISADAPRSPARAGRFLRARVVQRLGGAGQRAPARAARPARSAALPELRSKPRARPRALEARRDRGLRGAQRPLAWIDDALNEACDDWAAERERADAAGRAPHPAIGLTAEHVERLRRLGAALRSRRALTRAPQRARGTSSARHARGRAPAQVSPRRRRDVELGELLGEARCRRRRCRSPRASRGPARSRRRGRRRSRRRSGRARRRARRCPAAPTSSARGSGSAGSISMRR